MSQNAHVLWVQPFLSCRASCKRQHDSQYAFVVLALVATFALLQVLLASCDCSLTPTGMKVFEKLFSSFAQD